MAITADELIVGKPGQTALEITERRAAVEQRRQDREKPRKDFLLTGKKGETSEFEIVSNRETVERFSDQSGAPKNVEDLTDEERETWLRTGERPAGKEKKSAKESNRPKPEDFHDEEGKLDEAAFERAFRAWDEEDRAKQSAKDDGEPGEQRDEAQEQAAREQEQKDEAQAEKELLAQVEKESDTWWSEPAHAEAVKTFPERWQAMEAALTPEQKATVESSRKVIGQTISPELNRFVLNALARVKNLGPVYVELMREPDLLKAMNRDWTASANWANSPDARKLRISADTVIRHMLKNFDRRIEKAKNGAKASNGAKPHASTNGASEKPVRKLTGAGKPPIEASGASSSPADDGSSDAAWKRKDLTKEERGELYRTRKNKEESDARRAKYRRRR
jgi:hypothetical protein